MPKVSDDEVTRRLSSLAGWRLDEGALVKQFVFSGFPDAVAFVARLVPGAEAADHHPDITINYKRVTLRYSTHSEHAITEKDFEGVSMAERVATQPGT